MAAAAAAATSRSANIAELQRMFSNLDSAVIGSVLAANNGQVDLTIDHLLTMSIDNETENNIQQHIPTTPLRQLPSVMNIYEDDPPPYPGHEANHRATTMPSLPMRSRTSSSNTDVVVPREIQVQRWKTSYGQSRICYTGDLPEDFLRVESHSSAHSASSEKGCDDEHLAMLFQNEDFLRELRQNREFLDTLHSDQPVRSTPQRRSFNQFSNKPLPLPTPPTVETPKTPKVRAKMLQNVLSQIEQGQTMRTSMVPEESITQNEGYTYGKDDKERIPLPPAPMISEFDPLRPESNEEFIGRLKHMGKNSMDKFNQLARRFSVRKGPAGKYSKQPMMLNSADRHRLTNEFETNDEPGSVDKPPSNRYLASV